jgi:hypothetical protein
LKIQLVVHGGDSFGGVKMIISMVAFGVATIGAASAGKEGWPLVLLRSVQPLQGKKVVAGGVTYARSEDLLCCCWLACSYWLRNLQWLVMTAHLCYWLLPVQRR